MVRTYIFGENRSSIQSPVLMRSTIKVFNAYPRLEVVPTQEYLQAIVWWVG